MSTHYIPKNLKGESRILMIFTTHSLITTAIFVGIGGLLFLIFNMLKLKGLGIFLLVAMGLIGFAVGTVKIPKITGLNFTKNIEGDSIDEVVVRFAKFRANRKIYTYTKEDK